MGFDHQVEKDAIRGHSPLAVADDLDRADGPGDDRRWTDLGGQCARQGLARRLEFRHQNFGPARGRQLDWN
jgi:hypothetical protein